MSNDLSNLWISEEIKYQKKRIKELEKAYKPIKNKETTYAHGILKMAIVRKNILESITTTVANFTSYKKEKGEI